MKNTIKVSGFAAIALAIVLSTVSLTGCSSPVDGTDQTPAAADYDIGNLTQTAGNVTAVTITPKAGKSGGRITIYYDGSTTLPTTAGIYIVTFDVAAATGWKAASGLSAGTLTINPADTSGHTHVWGAWVQTKAPTETEDGEETRTCALDGTTETRAIAALNHVHDWGEWAVTTPATCTTAGEETRTCILDAAHKETRARAIDPNAHDWEILEGVAPTCTEHGHGTIKCKICGKTESGDNIPPLGHDAGEWHRVEPTCTENGTKELRCTRDQFVLETETIPALGHDWHWTATTPATFIAAGVETEMCTHDPSHTNGTRVIAQRIITTAGDWAAACTQLNGKTGGYTLTINGNIGIPGNSSISTYTFGTTSSGSLSVTLNGSGKLYLTSIGSIFLIGEDQTLIIDSGNLTLEGLTNGQNGANTDNNFPVIFVRWTGILELKNGTISGNTNSQYDRHGGGVYVGVGGTFTMSGGKISGNTCINGGGVYVAGGTFTMDSGRISGNIASNGGGGVNIGYTSGYEGTFTMNGGEISVNSAGVGGGVYGLGNTFIMNGGEISGNSASTSGGGVMVDTDPRLSSLYFTMNGGEIFGNSAGAGGGVSVYGLLRIVTGTIYGSETAAGEKKNLAIFNSGTDGAALTLVGTVQRGTFSGTGGAWVSKGNLSDIATNYAINNTIKVVNGDIVP